MSTSMRSTSRAEAAFRIGFLCTVLAVSSTGCFLFGSSKNRCEGREYDVRDVDCRDRPLALGGSVELDPRIDDGRPVDMVSSDTTVVRVVLDGGDWHAIGVGVGEAVVVAREGGEVTGEVRIRVERPTDFAIFAVAPLFFGESADPVFGTPKQLVDGKGTFALRLYHNGDLMTGRSAVDPATSPGFSIALNDRADLEEYVDFRVSELGVHDLSFTAGGTPFTVSAEGVDASAIKGMKLAAKDSVVVAQAHDANEVPIYGVDFEWRLDGQLQTVAASALVDEDSFDAYRLDSEEDGVKPPRRDLEASVGQYSQTIRVRTVTGTLRSTNDPPNCSVASPSLFGALLVLWGLRRRRRHHA